MKTEKKKVTKKTTKKAASKTAKATKRRSGKAASPKKPARRAPKMPQVVACELGNCAKIVKVVKETTDNSSIWPHLAWTIWMATHFGPFYDSLDKQVAAWKEAKNAGADGPHPYETYRAMTFQALMERTKLGQYILPRKTRFGAVRDELAAQRGVEE